jgi:hypothetical protein
MKSLGLLFIILALFVMLNAANFAGVIQGNKTFSAFKGGIGTTAKPAGTTGTTAVDGPGGQGK